MSPRARRRRLTRRMFRVVVSVAFFIATSPRGASIAEAAVDTGGSGPRIDAQHTLRDADACTVKIRARNGRRISNGAGVIISADGFILTAVHVISGYPAITVTLVSGDELPAVPVVCEEAYDIAVIKVRPTVPLTVATLADPSTVQQGTEAYIIGNPLGQGQSVVAGVVGQSATVNWDGHRAELPKVHGTVLKGNSGGGTFNAKTGELLGINVAKSSLQKDVGYFVPAERLLAILDRKLPISELADSQEIYNQLGVRLRKVKLIDGQYRDGLLITTVAPDSVAAHAGWQVGDVLVGMDKYKMVDQDALLYVMHDQVRTDNVSFLMARGDAVDHGAIQMFSSQALAASATVNADANLVAVGN